MLIGIQVITQILQISEIIQIISQKSIINVKKVKIMVFAIWQIVIKINDIIYFFNPILLPRPPHPNHYDHSPHPNHLHY